VPLEIISDSKYVVDGLTKHIWKWEAEGFRVTSNGELFKTTVARLRARKAKTSFKWIKGSSGIKGNEEADLLADQGANKEGSDIIDITIPSDLVLPGAKLKAMSQSDSYSEPSMAPIYPCSFPLCLWPSEFNLAHLRPPRTF
jgi:ribonuclease HI